MRKMISVFLLSFFIFSGTYAENIIAMGLMLVDTVPEDDGFGVDDTNFFDDEEDLDEY